MEIIIKLLKVANWLYYHDIATVIILTAIVAVALIIYALKGSAVNE